MAPRRVANPNAASSQQMASSVTAPASESPTLFTRPTQSSPGTKTTLNAGEVASSVWRNYLDATPQRTKLIDAFMVFLMLVGLLQFVYCVIVGNYPFNAFLSGFSATVGQFVLTASLRVQTGSAKAVFGSVSPERAFADYVFGSLILHFFCVNFIN